MSRWHLPLSFFDAYGVGGWGADGQIRSCLGGACFPTHLVRGLPSCSPDSPRTPPLPPVLPCSYISIYRHLQRNPDNQLYPLFEYFENWCQDENRHGDFFTAVLKSQPHMINDWVAKLWSRFFCLSVYITMYLNDHQRSAFYESLGLNTTQFNQHGELLR